MGWRAHLMADGKRGCVCRRDRRPIRPLRHVGKAKPRAKHTWEHWAGGGLMLHWTPAIGVAGDEALTLRVEVLAFVAAGKWMLEFAGRTTGERLARQLAVGIWLALVALV